MHDRDREPFAYLYVKAMAARRRGVPVTLSVADAFAISTVFGPAAPSLEEMQRQSANKTARLFDVPARIRPIRAGGAS